jgi:predicted DNA-binding transcriptional regulator YafY
MRRTERLFALADHLRGRRTGVTAQELADRFGVTIRTIYRDLQSLQRAELPLRADRGRGGGYALDRHYSLPPVNFTAREAAVLISAGDFLGKMRVLPFTTTLARAIDKVRAALSASAQRELVARLRSIQFIGVPAKAIPDEVRAAVEQAWFENRPLDITYEGYRGRTVRRVQIRQVVLDREHTLLNADDLGAPAHSAPSPGKREHSAAPSDSRPKNARQFRLDRITAARVVEIGEDG